MLPHVLAYLVTLLDGLLAGLFVCSAMIEHGARKMNAGPWIAYKHVKEDVFGTVMPVVFNAALLANIAAAFFMPSPILIAFAVALLVTAFAITLTVHLPLNKSFETWTLTDFPATWDVSRRRWRVWNLVRTIPVIAAFGIVLFVYR